MNNMKNGGLCGILGCPRPSNALFWGAFIVLTLGTALVGAWPSGATISNRATTSRSLSSLRAINVNIKKANFYNTTTHLTLNMTNHLQNATISGSSVGNGVLNARSASLFTG